MGYPRGMHDGGSDRDRAAKEDLLLRWLPSLREFVRGRMSPLLREREDSEDLVQSSCREVLAGLDLCEYRGEEAFRGFLFMAVLRKVQKRERDLRARRRDPRRAKPLDALSGDGELAAAHATPSQQAVAQEGVEQLRQAIAALPEEYRQVLSLARLAQLPRAEIARRMGRTEASVRGLLTRALQALSERLADDRSSAG